MRTELCKHWESFPEYNDYFEREDRIIVVSMILSDKINSVVEFAMGTGIVPKMLRDRGYGGRYVGTDITQNFIEISRRHNPNEEILFADLDETLPFKDKEFEASVIFTGIGYCQDIEKTFRELKRVTGKYLYICQFNLFSEENNLRFLKGAGWGNQYNKKWFDDMLERVGFKNVFEVSVTNAKDYYAYDNVPTSKVNHIYKLAV